MGSGWWEFENQRIAIGIPHNKEVNIKWAIYFRVMQLPPHYDIYPNDLYGIDLSREAIAEAIINEGKCEYIFWLDTDILAPRDVLRRLLGHNLDCVTGLYFAKKYEYRLPACWVWRTVENKPALCHIDLEKMQKGLVPIDAAGFGCMLTKTWMFRKLSRPWFSYNVGRYQDGKLVTPQLSEEFFFMDRIRKELGVQAYADTTIECDHMFFGEISGKNGAMDLTRM